MFKRAKKSLGSSPGTPKIGSVPLPAMEDKVVFPQPPKTRERTKLKWSDECMSDGELLRPSQPKKVMITRSATPKICSSPKIKPEDVPARPAAPKPTIDCRIQFIDLHWQLLPFSAGLVSKGRLYFDVAHHVDRIRIHSTFAPRPLTSSEMNKPAASKPLTHMTIWCEDLPWWPVVVRRKDGICCADIFHAIYDTYHQPLSDSDRECIPSKRIAGCEEAFKQRCKSADSLTAWEEAQGLRRVDLLKGKTMFVGLRRPALNQDQNRWVLQVCKPSS